jgi:hypothetical protein
MLAMKDSLMAAGFEKTNILTKVVPGGQHNEKLWREAFGPAWLWLSQKEPTAVTRTIIQQKKLKMYPNPVGDALNLAFLPDSGNNSLELYNADGKKVLEIKDFKPGRLNLKMLTAGFYVVKITTASAVYVSRLVKL